jgi:hypothetical protein
MGLHYMRWNAASYRKYHKVYDLATVKVEGAVFCQKSARIVLDLGGGNP